MDHYEKGFQQIATKSKHLEEINNLINNKNVQLIDLKSKLTEISTLANIDRKNGAINIAQYTEVVEAIENESIQMTLQESERRKLNRQLWQEGRIDQKSREQIGQEAID